MLYLRHYSFINNSNKGKNSNTFEIKDNNNINNNSKKENEIVHETHSIGSSQNKLSDVVSSFLNCSLNSLENYIIQQAPVKTDNRSNSFNNDIFEIDPHDNNNNIFIPYKMSSINKNYNEFIDLTNPDHIKGLLSLNANVWLRYSPEIQQYIDGTSNINMILILNFYVRSLPEIKTQLGNSDFNTKIGYNTTRLIISILINSQWFHNASYIIMRMNLPFNDLVNFINSLLDDELIFQKSDWLRYIFIINFYQFYKNINPLIITNIDCLNSDLNINRFKILNMLWKNKYNSLSEINDEINDCNEVIPNDNLIKLMHIYKSVDAIKHQHPFDLTKQISHFKVLISANFNDFNSKYFLSSFLNNLLSLNEYEFNYSQSSNLSNSQIESFIKERKNSILSYLIIKKRLTVKSFDLLTILKFKPNLDISLKLWDYHLLNMNNSLKNTIYYKNLIFYFVEQLKNTNKYSDILNTEFSNLSSSKKINIISSNLIKYLKHDNISTKNRVGGYIALTNNQIEHTHVMKQTISNLFDSNDNQFNYQDLLKILELIAIFSPTLLNKELLFELCCQIIERNKDNKEFQFFEPIEILNRTLEFLELIKSVDSSSKFYIKSFMPVLIKYYNYYIENCVNQNPSDLMLQKETKDLCFYLNRTFDIICKKSKKLTVLNPKSYKSKIYIHDQALLQQISTELFKLPKELIFNILKSRINWICMDQNDWIFIFHQKLFIFGVFLEILFRRSIRDFNEGVKFGNLNDIEFQNALKDEINNLSSNEINWELIERLSGFEWNKELSNVFFNSNETNYKEITSNENDENNKLGDGVIMVLNEIEKNNGKNFTDRFKMINGLKNRNANEIESFNNITDALFDSINESSNDIESDTDLLNLVNEKNVNGKNLSKSLLTQDSLEFNELYKDMKKYELFVSDDKLNINNNKINKNKKDKKHIRMKKKYNFKEKERLIRLYSPIRLKCKLIQSLIEQKPELIDAIIRRLYVEYRDRIPISLIHSSMIGLIQSNKKEIGFNEKINLIKILDKIVTIIYSTASSKVHSYLFMYFVRFKDFRISLVDLIINESQISNSGSLKTLHWAINKITNTANMNEYKNEFTRWTNELNNMKDSKTGFWNPQNKGKWIKVEE